MKEELVQIIVQRLEKDADTLREDFNRDKKVKGKSKRADDAKQSCLTCQLFTFAFYLFILKSLSLKFGRSQNQTDDFKDFRVTAWRPVSYTHLTLPTICSV